ncbi:MAG: hypothetical protein KDA96_17620 [Planctomycetaceae bacterium]|nr:hypothetical protein [Planctomycetaceae bacterium]
MTASDPYAVSAHNTTISGRGRAIAVVIGAITFVATAITLSCLGFGALVVVGGKQLPSPATLRQLIDVAGGRVTVFSLGVILVVSFGLSGFTTNRILRGFRLNSEAEERRRQLARDLEELRSLARASKEKSQSH